MGETKQLVDVPGLVRRARREGDLSQRDLAALLGVDQSTVSRWETGQAVPDVVTFARALALGGLDLAVLDAEGAEAAPMSDAPPRDGARRHFPAHLDLGEEYHPVTWELRLTTPHRRRRDARRARCVLDAGAGAQGSWWSVAAADHPTRAELDAERRRGREERCAQRVAELRARRGTCGHPHPEEPPCSCPVGCEEQARCLPTCGCRCEPGWLGEGPVGLAR